jgi:hypothetical protein
VWGASPVAGLPFIGWKRGEGPRCLQWPTLKELQCPGLKAPITGGVKKGGTV